MCVLDSVDILYAGLRAERYAPAEHLVENNTKTVDIRAMTAGFRSDLPRRANLLGTHVVGRADGKSGYRPALGKGRNRNAEIHEKTAITAIDQNVFGFDVAMDNSVFVSKLKSRQDVTRAGKNE